MNMINKLSTTAAFALAAAAFVHGGSLRAQESAPCPGGVLQTPVDGADLTLTSACTVKAGTYKFKDVHILANGVLTFEDAAIDFWAANILIEKDGSLLAGTPEAPIGTNGGTLTFHLWGKDQTGTNPPIQGAGVPCLTDERCGVPEDIWNSNAMGRPTAKKISDTPSGSTYPGASDPAIGKDYFYPYDPLFFDGKNSKAYFGYKVIGLSYGGTLQLFGRKGATYASPECGAAPTSSGSSWARLDNSVNVGDTTLVVDRPLTLKAKDRIVVTTTDYLPGHSEEMTVAADVTCDQRIPLDGKFKYAHNGKRFDLSDATVLNDDLRTKGAETRAAVGVLTRSIRIVSGGDTLGSAFPAEPPPESKHDSYYFGGQLIARQGFKSFQVQGVELHQLGQGGKMGHYPVHFHHARRVPQDTFLKDSSINESMTRWVVLHGTHNVNLERNVGWKSIGHGFYLEDGTEIDNKLIANLGVFARAAVDNVQNPRNVPGILAAPNLHGSAGENIPYRSDYDHPTVFWITNGWNDFKDNMAVGAGTCGVCYWLLPAANSGMSAHMQWTGYASMQTSMDRAGMTPLKSFVGNQCSAAMTSFQTVGETTQCNGVGTTWKPGLTPIRNPLASASNDSEYYPTISGGGGRFPTRCETEDCSTVPRCSAGSAGNCMVTVLDRYTTSFNWAPVNFAAIWLRPQWYLVTDSVITDVQQAGLTMVTGGGYSDSDVIPGHWALVRKSAFIGHTQENNLYASPGGPFSTDALRCALLDNGNRPGDYCLSADEGISFAVSNLGMYQRLFSVYDGPAYQESNAYLNVKKFPIDDCKPFVDREAKVGRCDPPDMSKGRQSRWWAGTVLGLQKSGNTCFMPNAAIGWKQPNGFYYPPAFHSRNLFFRDVDIRHFVLTPLVKEGSLETDLAKVEEQYCEWNRTLFDGFAGNDRQTVLNDNDGSLTGYVDTTVINKDDFFAAPVDATECRSENSSRTSPYAYVSTVIYPECALLPDTDPAVCARPPKANQPHYNDGGWNRACTSEKCYGVPLWRQNRMPIADGATERSIRMMGQETGQRSSLTINHGTYYFDTTLSKEFQLKSDCVSRDGTPCVANEFRPNNSYFLFLLFAKPDTKQTYRFYVGENTDFDPASIKMIKAHLGPNPPVFDETPGSLPPGRARWLNNDKATAKGVVEVDVSLDDLPGGVAAFQQAKKDKCQPASFCHWKDGAGGGQCVGVEAKNDAACSWAGRDTECPAGGCFGIKFTLPSGFRTLAHDAPNPRPAPTCVQRASPWDVSLTPRDDGACPQASDNHPLDFCAN